MDYYHAAWLVLLVSAFFLNIVIFLLFKAANSWVRGFFSAAAVSLPLFPVIVESNDYGQTFAPLLARIAMDLISGNVDLSQWYLPVSLMLVEILVLCFLLSKLFGREQLSAQQD